jgi:hypothetical protein
MGTIKLPVSFNEAEQASIGNLIELMGIAGVYGAQAKALKFSITLAISAIENPQKVYSGLQDTEMSVYFQSVQRAELKARLVKTSKELIKQAKEV